MKKEIACYWRAAEVTSALALMKSHKGAVLIGGQIATDGVGRQGRMAAQKKGSVSVGVSLLV